MIKDKNKSILSMVNCHSNVLHLGCTDAPYTEWKLERGVLLHKSICETGAKVVGVDVESDSINMVQEALSSADIRNIDAHDLSSLLVDFPNGFDLIIAGDIIEHLENPGLFLDSCNKVLAKDGVLYISTVNALSIVRFAKSLFHREVVHPEHTAYYTHKTLARLLKMRGLTVTEKGYYRLGYFFSGINLSICSWFEEIMCIISPLWAEGIQAKAVKNEDVS